MKVFLLRVGLGLEIAPWHFWAVFLCSQACLVCSLDGAPRKGDFPLEGQQEFLGVEQVGGWAQQLCVSGTMCYPILGPLRWNQGPQSGSL